MKLNTTTKELKKVVNNIGNYKFSGSGTHHIFFFSQGGTDEDANVEISGVTNILCILKSVHRLEFVLGQDFK